MAQKDKVKNFIEHGSNLTGSLAGAATGLLRNMAPTDTRLKDWLDWIDAIKDETIKILDQRQIYREYLEIVKRNKDIQLPPTFHFWIRDNYIAFVVMGIRRQLDPRRGTISLKRLLEQIIAHPGSITKEWHRSLYKDAKPPHPELAGFWQRQADKNFEMIAGKRPCFDRHTAEADMKKLIQLGEKISDYANERIAHHQAGQKSADLPTYKNLDTFIDELKRMVEKYLLLFTGSQYASLQPFHQENWTEVLTKAWIKK